MSLPGTGLRPSTIVFVHPSDELYGADRVLLQMQEALPDHLRDRAEFWLPTDVPHGATPLCVELERHGGRVRHLALPIMRRAYRRPVQLLQLAGRARGTWREMVRRRPDIVYCTTSAALIAAPLASAARVPCVVGHVQEIWSPSDRRILGTLARSLDRVLTISRPVRESLPPALLDRTDVVLNATPEPASYVPLQGRAGPVKFLVASRWNGWKGHRTLLAAWDRLEDPGELIVLGGPPSSGAAVDVRAIVRALRRPETVTVVGEVHDPHTYFEQADVIVVPSDSPEPFGLVAAEAFARGRPVVGSDGGGLSDIISPGIDGWLYEIGDVGALADVLAGLGRDTVTQAGARARSTYEARFTAERFGREWRRSLDLSDHRRQSVDP